MRERGHAGKHNIENRETEQLCEDEGCPHHGIPHVCVENKEEKNVDTSSSRIAN